MNDKTAVREIEAVFARQVELWNRHDVREYVALWAEDSDFVNVLGMHRHGRQELLAELEYLHAGRFRNTQNPNRASHGEALDGRTRFSAFMVGDERRPRHARPCD